MCAAISGSGSSVSIYGASLELLENTKEKLALAIDGVRNDMIKESGRDPIDHLLFRIKSDASMREKLRRKKLEETTQNAINSVYDAVGARVVCSFLDDVYAIEERLKNIEGFRVVEEKDYIRHAKENGYRSFHLILRVDEAAYAEIQLRTISMDTWAALEHKLRYKKNISGNIELIANELKRCADELASTDVSMQTLRNMIEENE